MASTSAQPVESSYYYQGKPVALVRSNQLSVRFDAGLNLPAARRLVRGLSSSAQLSRAAQLRGRAVSTVDLSGLSQAGFERALAELKAARNVDFAYPVWLDPATGSRMLLTDELIVRARVRLAASSNRRALALMGLAVEHPILYSQDEYVLRLLAPKSSDPLAVSRKLAKSGLVDWAEPNFVQEYHKDYVPNDPLYPQQWHLNNSGQVEGKVHADARLPGAWDLEKGDPSTVIAIVDDGVQLSHPDLAPNIYTNRGEIPGNHVDDDHNGFVDDVHGWNFVFDTNDVTAEGSGTEGDDHGTAVAGIAAARGDNGIGVSGACPRCSILPVKINDGGYWATDSQIADAIRYAGQIADVLNLSWGGDEPSAAIGWAIQYAATTGRDGKGAVIVAASGNGASGFVRVQLTGIPPGTYRFSWVYSKDGVDFYPVGADSGWLSWVRFQDGEWQNFESGAMPSGWSTGGDGGAAWSVVDDPDHADVGRCQSYAAKAGTIGNSQTTHLDVVKTFQNTGTLDFLGYVSSEQAIFRTIDGLTAMSPLDGLTFLVDQGNDGTIDWSSELFAGVPPTGLVYPAEFAPVIAVGASTALDCPAPYSQFGPGLSLVAPSSGGDLTPGIVTTDRTGAYGYDPGDYTYTFSGTSAASPLAAGVAGLILSRNPGLTATQVRRILDGSADKIDPSFAAYDAKGYSNRVGYGRIDAQRALAATPLPSTIALERPIYKTDGGRAVLVKIRRDGNLSGTTSVDFATVGASARGGADFAVVSRTIRFEPGQRTKSVYIRTHKGRFAGRNKSLSLRLTYPSPGAILATPRTSTLTIVEGAPAKRLMRRSDAGSRVRPKQRGRS